MKKLLFSFLTLFIVLCIKINITSANYSEPMPYAQIKVTEANEISPKSNVNITIEKEKITYLGQGVIKGPKYGLSVDESANIITLGNYQTALKFIKNYRKNFSIKTNSYAIIQQDNKSIKNYLYSIGTNPNNDILNYFSYSNNKYYTKQQVNPDDESSGSELILTNNKIYHGGFEINLNKATFEPFGTSFTEVPNLGIPSLTYLYKDSFATLNTNNYSVKTDLIILNNTKMCRVTFSTTHSNTTNSNMYFFNMNGELKKYAYEIVENTPTDEKKIKYYIGIYDILKFSKIIPDKSVFSAPKSYTTNNSFWSLNFI